MARDETDAARPGRVEQLDEDTCWRLLEGEQFGRLGYRLVDEVHVVPVNYVVRDRHLLLRSGPGSKLFAAALHSDVALEIDHHDEGEAWSVLARGRARRLEEDEQHVLDHEPRRPWIRLCEGGEVIEVETEVVTGRRFTLLEPAGDPVGAS